MPATDDEVFTVRRHLDAPPDRVFAAFIDPSRLEQWFVVDGFQTPAERIRSTPQPGGGVEAVMVSDADGSEIPFGFRYRELDPPHRVVLEFDDPREVVTVTIEPARAATSELTYTLATLEPPSDPAAAQRGAEDMLDRIAAGIDQGLI
ncbi:SRPBCC family protein [Agromyces ramosus]|uniref:Uncharacterized protein YndB with AHSA1/START domain n=1 Tax=Agromyces ramosus TaxID=33879 RepID=A0ABU0RC56_9MICO|nr:SRPBCC domain-containing protein [Agromyces ramosus]MDQ0895653.1 uncharacterized protein YndB with AHSA1/START domain [Agromyces ramosus]